MSIRIGTNIRRDGSDSIDLIRRSEAMLARLVPLPDVNLSSYLGGLKASGTEPFAVLAKESFGLGPGPIDWALVERMLATYAARYGPVVRYWQVGNEWDLESDSSWTMSSRDLVELGQRTRRALGPAAYLIVGGAADGSPSDEPEERLSGMDLGWANAIAIHTYGQGVPGWVRDDGLFVLPCSPYGFPSTVRDLIDGYHAEAPTKDLWITEHGFRWDELGQSCAAQYAEAYLAYLLNRCPDVSAFTQFCLTDAQVYGFGLYDHEGGQHQTAPVFARYASLARAQLEGSIHPPAPEPAPQPAPAPAPEPVQPVTTAEAEELAWRDLFLAATENPARARIVYATHLGIVKYWREHYDDLGSAVGPERQAEDGTVFQGFALGLVRWDPSTGASKVA